MENCVFNIKWNWCFNICEICYKVTVDKQAHESECNRTSIISIKEIFFFYLFFSNEKLVFLKQRIVYIINLFL